MAVPAPPAVVDRPPHQTAPADAVHGTGTGVPGAAGVPGVPGVRDGADTTCTTCTVRTARPVAPGVRLASYVRQDAGARLRAHALTVDLDARTGVRVDYLSTGTVTGRRALTELAAHHRPGAGRRTVAAVNADFFDLGQTGAPQGPGIGDGRLTHSPAPGAHRAAGIGPGGAGRILKLYFDGTLTLPSGTRPLAAYNAANVPADGVGLYTPAWGAADRALTVDTADRTAEALVRDGTVVSVAGRPGSGPVPAGAAALVGRGSGAAALAALRPGDRVSWGFRPRADGGPVPRTAVGGRELLVVDGVPLSHEGRPNNAAAPRTAVGFSRDGRVMHLLTVDGRQAASAGVTLTELAAMMRRAGAHHALNLDGGGSSTLVARDVGSDAVTLRNSPSGGRERPVPNGLALTAPDGSGRLKGFWVQTAAAAADRVFPGLTRRLTAAGHDEAYGPAPGEPHWHVVRPRVGRIDRHGVFHARRPGATAVRAHRGPAHGGIELTVLGELARLEPTVRHIALPDSTAAKTFGLFGHDADGAGAPVEPADVTLAYDRTRFEVHDDGRGSFTVTARAGGGTGLITAAAGGLTATLTVTAAPAAPGFGPTVRHPAIPGSLGHDGCGTRWCPCPTEPPPPQGPPKPGARGRTPCCRSPSPG
ncbi:phosphodiester glycosidase family protein [Streptomyces sp. PR69]|uniref:phosphodiester glycosidase family protein n=1 Tax=Streptomyces sp. PR69 TaxID=2984950 RepID=UPI003A5B9743